MEKGVILKKIWEMIGKLLSIKSIVTLIMTIVFAVLSINGTLKSEQFVTLFTIVIAFYFGTQSVKEQ